MSRDTFDDLLDRSAPATRATTGAEFDVMIRAARREATARRRRMPRVALGAGLAVLLAGGAGVAVATDLFPWHGAAQDPFVLLEYTLPSGITCEQRVFEVETTDPAAGAWLRDYAADRDLVAQADVDGYLARLDSWEQPQYDTADERMWQGITGAVWELVVDEAQEAGFSSAAFTGEQSQTFCLDAGGEIVFPNGSAGQ